MAIALDATSLTSAVGAAGSATFSHTIGAGVNITLWVAFFIAGNTTDQLSSVTYNGVAMTQVMTPVIDTGNGNGPAVFYMYYMGNPPAGAHNIVITNSAPTTSFTNAAGVSYSGTNTSSQPDGTTNGTNTNPTTGAVTATITTATSGDWGLLFVALGRTPAANTGSTLRVMVNAQVALFDSNGAFASTGSNSLAWSSTASGGGNATWIMAGIKAFTAPVVNSNFFFAVDR